MISQASLRQLLTYNPETGVFSRKVGGSGPNNYEGCEAGTLDRDGYQVIKLRNKSYFAHRLAFLYMTGQVPEQVDHINRIRGDNRWCNLRPATRSANQLNTASRKGSSSKYLGVSWFPRRQKWRASIRVDGKVKHLGYFECEADAATVYNFAAYYRNKKFKNFNTPASIGLIQQFGGIES